MSEKFNVIIGLMEGRSFIIGREGHIYVNSPLTSKRHAEIKVKDGKIHLRDLNSTNGTFLYKNKKLIQFDAGYVSPLQTIMIGDRWYMVIDLLSTARDFAVLDDAVTEIRIPKQEANRR